MYSQKDRGMATRVARFKFLDKIKASHADQTKENLNSNDIHQHNHHLPLSKSSRKDHSLQRKKPVNLGNYQMKPNLNQDKQLESLQQTVSYQSPAICFDLEQTVPDCRQQIYKNKASCTSKLNSLNSLYELLQGQNSSKKYQFQCVNLQQQQEVLDHIKIIWESTNKMKERAFFIEEVLAIENSLKSIIMKMARPKFNSIEQACSLTLKIPSFKYSPLENMASLKDSKDNSVSHFKPEITPIESPEKGIQLKKILYMLQEKQKQSMQLKTDSQKQYQQENLSSNLHQDLGEDRYINKRNLTPASANNSSKNDSSFNNCSQSELSGVTVCQMEKMNNSHSNDKIFLKNIVKRAKSGLTDANYNEMKGEHHCKKIVSGDIGYDSHVNSLSSFNSQQEIYFQNQRATAEFVEAEDESQYKHRGQTLQTVQDDSESKRAVLNQIISMLNLKYHKNIKLQPFKN